MLQICKDHAADKLDSEVELTTCAITINSKVLKMEITEKKKGWEVTPEKTAEVSHKGHDSIEMMSINSNLFRY